MKKILIGIILMLSIFKSYGQIDITAKELLDLSERYVKVKNLNSSYLYESFDITSSKLLKINENDQIVKSNKQFCGWHKVVYKDVEGWLFGMDVYEVNKNGDKYIVKSTPMENLFVHKNNRNNNKTGSFSHSSTENQSTEQTIVNGLAALFVGINTMNALNDELGNDGGNSSSSSNNNTTVKQVPCLKEIKKNEFKTIKHGHECSTHKVICGNGVVSYIYYYPGDVNNNTLMGLDPAGWYQKGMMGAYNKDSEKLIKKICDCN